MQILAIFIIIIAAALILALSRKQDSDKAKSRIVWHPVEKSFPYVAMPSVMTKSEFVFYRELLKQLPSGFHVAPKMRLADFIKTRPELIRNIWAKHVDFLITDKALKPLLGIEINGPSHSKPDNIKRDRLVNEIFHSARIPLETVQVGTVFSDEIKRIVSQRLNS